MENVIKQGYLRKSFHSERGLSGILERIDPTKWFVLGVRDGAPYLEYYDKEMDVFSAEPINTFNLSNCRRVTYTQVRNASLHRFSLDLQDRVIELATPDRGKMLEWYNILESTLDSLGILHKEDHEHVYSFCPAVVNFGSSFRKQQEAAKAEEDDVFGTVGTAEQQEKMKRKESIDNAALSKPNDSAASLTRSSTMDDGISSDYSGDFMDSDFWQKNKIEGSNEMLSARINLPTPAVRVSLLEINNNNKSKTPKTAAPDPRNGVSMVAVASAVGTSGVGVAAGGRAVDQTEVKGSLCSSIKTSQDNCCNGESSRDVSLPSAKCGTRGAGDSGCAAAVSCQSSCSQDQNDAKNENLYSDFPIADQQAKSATNLLENSSESLPCSHDTCVKQSNPSPSAWVKFDEDSACDSAVNCEHHLLKIDSSFVRDKLRHSTGSTKRKTSQNDDDQATDVQIARHSMHCPINPPLPPRNDSLLSRRCTVAGPARESSQASAVLANSRLPETNGIPPLPPRRVDSVSENRDINPPPPLPSRDFQNSNSAAPPNLPRRSYVTRHSAGDSEGAAALPPTLPGRPQHRLSMKMKLDRSDKAFNVVSLKQSQMEILQLEMNTKELVVQLPQKDCLGLALVDVYGSVWIAGWNQKDHPKLHDKFHVGDHVKKVDNATVFTAAMANKLIKSAKSLSSVDIVVRRLPHAKVLSIRRSAEGESLGIKREGGTGEIIYVDLNGLAAKNGLSTKAPCIFSQNLCNWFITEINSRPVSLFFKELEIEHRLNAVGKEISLVVQPIDFVNEIKKGLKKLKNHKQFIVK
ncbi:uncharacterized protein LOC121383171 [Gigantopelta aegis]|uniref:uncharacterized protein LOC121383171 n=1 Tax=Gigantopelta aegis TaxID=1735272 RepID=UPI001B888789|nr:uncharacterized protein LOC121383171 [Gigantopelta aegis]XP_041368941.1 uncharacterized protein LOC121383171 [Gigantopelta aegis]XP_041368942.1 uncharacterized protein LOC121383171 [Gigantopelta aegis]XP_041368943.1 uncharacterized protein LOC121383171 [Gigantopelta aegis]XP_041368944.1 uncharacterized protein LOC121383171 [Gigantopelta aegis]